MFKLLNLISNGTQRYLLRKILTDYTKELEETYNIKISKQLLNYYLNNIKR